MEKHTTMSGHDQAGNSSFPGQGPEFCLLLPAVQKHIEVND